MIVARAAAVAAAIGTRSAALAAGTEAVLAEAMIDAVIVAAAIGVAVPRVFAHAIVDAAAAAGKC